jgi:hypothetical protein
VSERADHNGVGLLKEGSVYGLVLGAWLWWVVALGAHVTVGPVQYPPSIKGIVPTYEVSCQAPKTLADGGVGCRGKHRFAVGTTREPGSGLTQRPPGGES